MPYKIIQVLESSSERKVDKPQFPDGGYWVYIFGSKLWFLFNQSYSLLLISEFCSTPASTTSATKKAPLSNLPCGLDISTLLRKAHIMKRGEKDINSSLSALSNVEEIFQGEVFNQSHKEC